MAAGRTRDLSLPASAVLAAALPILFLHVDYQPGFTIHTGTASEHLVLSDLALLAVGITALVAGLRRGFAPLRAGWPVWIAGGIFLADVLAGSVYPKLWASGYEASTHAVTALKFAEYALLALSVPLLVRTRRDAQWVVGSLIAWSVVATVTGIAQIFGADILEAWAAGRRQPSFLGHHDFAALSGAALAICLVGIALRPVWRPRLALLAVAGVSGVVGIVISASTADAAGLAIAAAAVLLAARLRHWLDRRRALAIVGITAVVLGGVFVMRAGEINQFLRFVGIGQAKRQNGVESYVQRTMLVYIGWRIFEDNPIGGAGWQASTRAARLRAVCAGRTPGVPRDASARLPVAAAPLGRPERVRPGHVRSGNRRPAHVPRPARDRPRHGGPRRPPRSPAVAVTALVSLVWLVLVMGVLSALGLVAGIPSDALLWLALGFCVVAAGGKELVRARDLGHPRSRSGPGSSTGIRRRARSRTRRASTWRSGCRRRRNARRRTSAATASSTSAAAGSRTTRTSPPTRASTSVSTRSRTRSPTYTGRSRPSPSTTRPSTSCSAPRCSSTRTTRPGGRELHRVDGARRTACSPRPTACRSTTPRPSTTGAGRTPVSSSSSPATATGRRSRDARRRHRHGLRRNAGRSTSTSLFRRAHLDAGRQRAGLRR